MQRLVLGALLLSSVVAQADDAPLVEPITKAEAKAFVRARGADARDLLLGTPQPHVAAPTTQDCAALYQQRVALMRQQLNPGPTDFYSDPRAGAALFTGSVWSPGFYYLPFRALQNYRDQTRRPQREAELDALRAASAEQRCFER